MFFGALTRAWKKNNSTKKMIINVTQPEESRVVIIDEGVLQELSIETGSMDKIRGNIYKGVVQRVTPSLHAAFVDYGGNRPGFLPLDEVHPSNYPEKQKKPQQKLSPDKILRKNQEVVIQVAREEKGKKGASLTTYLSFPGRYLVIMPGHKRTGISRKIEDEAERSKLKDIGRNLNLPESMGFIIRTAGLNKTKKDLQKDVNYLLRLWKAIESRSRELKAPSLIYHESSMVIQSIRDYFTTDISEVLIDNLEVYKKAKEFFKQVIPKYQKAVKLYDDKMPIFTKYNIEEQIESLYKRTAPLKSGGSISIDPTEALVAIDVNTARFTRVKNQEESALITNLEAAEEIGRQLRLRNLGGLIAIDFIDMKNIKGRQQVERELKNAFKNDKAKVEISRISKFGILEMSREHLGQPLFDGGHVECVNCRGNGKVRSTESLALALLRQIYHKASTGDVAKIEVTLSADVASYLLNQKRDGISDIEKQFDVTIVITTSTMAPLDDFNLECIKR